MGKFCGKCGAALVEGVAFCASCGAAVESMGYSEPEPQQSVVNEDMYAENQKVIENGFAGDETRLLYEPQPQSQYQPQQQPQYEQQYQAQPQPQYQAQQQYMGNSYYPDMYAQPTKKSGKKKLVIILSIAGAVVIGAIVLICCLIFGGNDYEDAIEAYLKLSCNDISYNNVCDAFGESNVEMLCGDNVQLFKDLCSQAMAEIEDENTLELYDFTIYNVSSIDYEELEDISDEFYSVVQSVAEEGIKVRVNYTYTESYHNINYTGTDSLTLTLVKFNGEWCVVDTIDIIEDIF
ncbi:MAG: zinc ribbon domain-containing protein [Ruminococcus sp.]|nr:zinc ribbon domain-containing protein [Ruminococcus sp.]